MAEITWTEEAERWLKDIHDYIAQDNPAAAEGVRHLFIMKDLVSVEGAIVKGAKSLLQQLIFRSMPLYHILNL